MCQECEYKSYLEKIEEILENGYSREYQRTFLKSVYRMAEERKHITPAQAEAIDKIY